MWNKVPKNEYHKGKPGKKQNPFKKDLIAYDQKSMMGYRDDSPYRQLPVIDINTPNGYIDMSATGIPLFANGQYLPPYSGQHFMGTDVVREIPINNWDNPSLDVHLVHPHYKPLPQGKDMDPGFSPKSFPSQKPTGYYNPQHPEYFQKGGWLDAYQQGGDPSIPELNQAKKGGSKGHNKKTGLKVNREFTSKNIQSSINDLMLRNETLYGPAGKKRYKPDLKYQQGGWLDAYQSGGTPIHYTSEAEYQKGLLNKNKSAQQLAAEREWAGKKVAKAEAAKKAATPPPAYSWSGSDMMSQATPVQPQVAMTYSDAPHHDIVTESKTIKAKNEAIKAKNEEDYKTQTDLYGPVLGAIRYYANKADDYSEGTGPTYYYKDPNTNQATAFKGASAYEQFGKYMPDVAYSAFPLGEIVEPIISPVGRYLKSVFTFAPELSGAVDEATINSRYKFPKYPLQSAETQVGIDPVHYRAVDAVKNNSGSYYNFSTETFEPNIKKSYLVNPQFGHDYVLPEGMGIDQLNEFARRSQAGLIKPYELNDVHESLVKLNPELKNINVNKTDLIHGVASHIAPQDLMDIKTAVPFGYSDPSKGFWGNFIKSYNETKWNQFTDRVDPLGDEGLGFRFSPERQKEIMKTYKPLNTSPNLSGSANMTEDVNLIHNPTRSEQLNAHAFDIYKGDTRVGEISGNRLPNGDFQTTDIKVHPEYQRQGIGTQAYTQLNASLNPGNKVTSWGAFVENPEGIKPGMNTWESMVNKGLARRTPQGGYEMIPLNTPTELPGSPNNLGKNMVSNVGSINSYSPVLGSPMGTVDDIKNINKVNNYGLKTDINITPYQRKLDTDLIKYNDINNTNLNIQYPTPTEADKLSGYTDIPQFNQDVRGLTAQMSFGKRPLITNVNVDPRALQTAAQQGVNESMGNYPMYYKTLFGNPIETRPGVGLGTMRPLTGLEMFQQIQPNKYGGTPRKSDKKLVNYSQNPNFVKTQNSNWLDKYK